MTDSSKAVVSLLIAGILALPAPAWCQQVPGPQSNLAQQESGGLKVVVVQGENAQNNIRTKSATQVGVEVRDEQDKPVPGAEVVFQLPAAGPGGVFNGWMRNQTARTNAQGQATTSGFAPNDEEGRFNIKVTARQGNKTGTAIIAQSNLRSSGSASAAVRSKRKTLWVLLGLGAAAAIGGGIAASRGGSSSSTPSTTPVSITAGPITVAAPR